MSGPEQAIGVGIVGVGRIATQHLRAYARNPHARVVALCDVNADRLAAAARLADGGVRTYTGFEALLADPQVSLVSICTPNAFHGQQTLAALTAGKHVLVEKPVVTSVEELVKLRGALGRSRLTCAGGMILRFHPLYRDIQTLRGTGQLGSLFVATVQYLQRLEPTAGNYAWLVRRETAGSATLAGGSHAVDLLRWLVGAEVVEVFAYALRADNQDFDYPPTMLGLLRFATGLVATVTICLEAPVRYRLALELVGTGGIVRDNRLWSRRSESEPEEPRALLYDPPSGDMSEAPFPAEIDDVVNAIRTRGRSSADLTDVLASHEVCLALDRSAGEGHPISLPLSSS